MAATRGLFHGPLIAKTHDSRMKAKIKPFSFRAKTLGGFFRLALYRPMLLPIALKGLVLQKKVPEGLGMRLTSSGACSLKMP